MLGWCQQLGHPQGEAKGADRMEDNREDIWYMHFQLWTSCGPVGPWPGVAGIDGQLWSPGLSTLSCGLH